MHVGQLGQWLSDGQAWQLYGPVASTPRWCCSGAMCVAATITQVLHLLMGLILYLMSSALAAGSNPAKVSSA